MTDRKPGDDTARILYKSEIFKDGPRTASNYSSSIGAEQGLETFGGATASARRPRPNKTHLEAAREIPVFAETDVLVVGGGPAGTRCGHRRRAPRRRCPAGRALQPPRRAFHRRPRHLDRPHVGLGRQAHHPRLRRGDHGPAAQGGGRRPAARRLGLQGCRHRRLLGAAHAPPSTASSPGRRWSTRRR